MRKSRKTQPGRTLRQYSRICHRIARKKGFWDVPEGVPKGTPRNVAEMLMLTVSELAEAMEADRKSDAAGFREEIADTFIRLFDLCGGLGIDIESEIEKKQIKNLARPYKHGKKY